MCRTNRKLCDFAISKMSSTNPFTGEVVHVVKLDKEAVDALLKTYRYVKDVIDDVDDYDGLVFNRWYTDMCRTGIAIDWEEML